jgi:hypothetical protein
VSRHSRLALTTIAAAILLDVILGWLYSACEHLPALHGMYCGLSNGVTVGCDVTPVNASGYVLNAIECLLAVPLWTAAFSLLTSALTSGHVAASEKRIKAHVEARLRHHIGGGDDKAE